MPFRDGSDKETVSVYQKLCESQEKYDREPGNDKTSVQGEKHELKTGGGMEESKLTKTKKGEAGEKQRTYASAVTMMNGVLWDVTPCGSCKNRSFGGI
jgi:hypothetical protein